VFPETDRLRLASGANRRQEGLLEQEHSRWQALSSRSLTTSATPKILATPPAWPGPIALVTWSMIRHSIVARRSIYSSFVLRHSRRSSCRLLRRRLGRRAS
jgi:hypothetical protein